MLNLDFDKHHIIISYRINVIASNIFKISYPPLLFFLFYFSFYKCIQWLRKKQRMVESIRTFRGWGEWRSDRRQALGVKICKNICGEESEEKFAGGLGAKLMKSVPWQGRKAGWAVRFSQGAAEDEAIQTNFPRHWPASPTLVLKREVITMTKWTSAPASVRRWSFTTRGGRSPIAHSKKEGWECSEVATNGLALSCVRNHNEVPVEVWRGDGGEDAGRVVPGLLADGRWRRQGGGENRSDMEEGVGRWPHKVKGECSLFKKGISVWEHSFPSHNAAAYGEASWKMNQQQRLRHLWQMLDEWRIGLSVLPSSW